MKTILLRHAHFISDNSGPSIEILRIHYKADENIHFLGRAYKEMSQFLTLKKAILNLPNQDDRGFVSRVLSAVSRLI